MSDAKPTAKVAAGGAAGFVAALIMWAISASGVDVPEGVSVYVPVIASAIAAYLTPDRLVKLGREAARRLDRYDPKHGVGHGDE